MHGLELKTEAIRKLRRRMGMEQAACREHLLCCPETLALPFRQYLIRDRILAGTVPALLTSPNGIFLYNDQLAALLRCPRPLAAVYREYIYGEIFEPFDNIPLLTSVGEALEHTGNDLLRREFLARKAVGDYIKMNCEKELEDLLD
ncbi:MAG: hypothetical protein IJX93_00910 [Clostridia bacterium]|nr:hypothetical protein [Clostridia bacterium]